MNKNVLVLPCGSEIGLEIYRSLAYSTHFTVYGGSSVDDHGKFVYQNYIGDIPYVDDDNFINAVSSIIDKYKIDFIIPAHDSVLLSLAQAKEKGEINCAILTSPLDTCEVSRSKQKTYEVFKGIIPVPKIYKSKDDVSATDLPVFMKPDVGQGSKGTYSAKTLDDLNYYASRQPELLILESLPGKEYTVDCFTNKEGELMFCEGRERRRILNGISVDTVTVNDKRFREIAEKINKKLKFQGVWFFQVKENQAAELVLMEIAPRVAGTMALVRAKGVNLVLLSLFDALGYEVEIFENKYEIVIDRALENSYQHNLNYKHVYLDFDDLVIFKGKINPQVMAFVYQCLNNQIKVHLLTRHKQDLEHSLRKFRLINVFDELIWLKEGEPKSEYIIEKDAIFIDDSFAERKKVADDCGIPVFDAHMIESLMEKF